jgi:hypothetical protein
MCWTAVEDGQLRHAWSSGRASRTFDGELLLDVLEVFLLLGGELGGERHGDCLVD